MHGCPTSYHIFEYFLYNFFQTYLDSVESINVKANVKANVKEEAKERC